MTDLARTREQFLKDQANDDWVDTVLKNHGVQFIRDPKGRLRVTNDPRRSAPMDPNLALVIEQLAAGVYAAARGKPLPSFESAVRSPPAMRSLIAEIERLLGRGGMTGFSSGPLMFNRTSPSYGELLISRLVKMPEERPIVRLHLMPDEFLTSSLLQGMLLQLLDVALLGASAQGEGGLLDEEALRTLVRRLSLEDPP